MKLLWTASARHDRRTIREYIASHNLAAAVELDEHLSARTWQLLRQPASGRVGRIHGTRELVVHRHYIIVYAVTGKEIQILRVLHSSRCWP